MGTIPAMFAKQLMFQNEEPAQYQGGQPLGFNSAMGNPGIRNEDDVYQNTRLRCSGANTICEAKKFVNGEPTTDWDFVEASRTGVFDNVVCQHAFDTTGDPCLTRGRGLPPGPPSATSKNPFDVKKWQTKDWVLAGSLAVVLIGSITIMLTAKKAQ